MAIHDGLNYRQWQKRNTKAFGRLSTSQKKELRSQGYRNVGWINVRRSWEVLHNSTQPISLFERKLQRGDISGAIKHSLLEAEATKAVAQDGLQRIRDKHREVEELVSSVLNKYPEL